MDDLVSALQDAGGARAPKERGAQLRTLLGGELAHGRAELGLARSGRERPVLVAFAATAAGLAAVTPAPAALRADPEVAEERTWLLVAAAVGALVEVAPAGSSLRAGDLDENLVLVAPGTATDEDAELAALAFDEQVAGVDRLRSRAVALPGHVVDGATGELRDPIGATHPLRVAHAVARLGGRPADPASGEEHEDAVLALLADAAGGLEAVRPHDDPEPARRVARRVLQRLDGMGKWGGYHTEFAHLARGFRGNDRALAEEVGEALLEAGLLAEKPSVGQRHVFLNPRRVRDIRALIDEGVMPSDLRLP
jgi:hypothetical protein